MATAEQNLSEFSFEGNCSNFYISLVVSEWNHDITGNLLNGAKETLLKAGVPEEHILVHMVPGTYELALGCQWVIDADKPDGVIAIGSVIQGETKHFDFVCDAAAQGIMRVAIDKSTPTIFCVLTDNNRQQSIDRSGGKHGNKGVEAAVACLKMIQLRRSL